MPRLPTRDDLKYFLLRSATRHPGLSKGQLAVRVHKTLMNETERCIVELEKAGKIRSERGGHGRHKVFVVEEAIDPHDRAESDEKFWRFSADDYAETAAPGGSPARDDPESDGG